MSSQVRFCTSMTRTLILSQCMQDKERSYYRIILGSNGTQGFHLIDLCMVNAWLLQRRVNDNSFMRLVYFHHPVYDDMRKERKTKKCCHPTEDQIRLVLHRVELVLHLQLICLVLKDPKISFKNPEKLQHQDYIDDRSTTFLFRERIPVYSVHNNPPT